MRRLGKVLVESRSASFDAGSRFAFATATATTTATAAPLATPLIRSCIGSGRIGCDQRGRWPAVTALVSASCAGHNDRSYRDVLERRCVWACALPAVPVTCDRPVRACWRAVAVSSRAARASRSGRRAFAALPLRALVAPPGVLALAALVVASAISSIPRHGRDHDRRVRLGARAEARCGWRGSRLSSVWRSAAGSPVKNATMRPHRPRCGRASARSAGTAGGTGGATIGAGVSGTMPLTTASCFGRSALFLNLAAACRGCQCWAPVRRRARSWP